MKNILALSMCCLGLLAATSLMASEQKDDATNPHVKVSAKDLADIRRQMRLMRAEMAELNERIERLTAQRDDVRATDKGTEEKKDDSHSE